ncbi:MAG: chromate transporter [Bacteriovoracia bacterium]
MFTRTHLDIFIYFIKLGLFGFGGPFAVMGSMQKDLIEKRKWLSLEQFSQALSFIKALPGPVAAQIAVYVGYKRGGRIGGLIAGVALIFPSFCLMLLLGYFYDDIKQTKFANSFFEGMQLAAIGVILSSVVDLAKPHLRKPRFWFFAIASGLAFIQNRAHEPIYIVGCGILSILFEKGVEASKKGTIFEVGSLGILLVLGWVSFKSGAFLFGSGLAIIPALAHDVVTKHHWLTHQQFLDAIAFGQITPGPVLISITFIGFKAFGFIGAFAATFFIFLPSFLNMLTWFPSALKKFQKTKYAQVFLTGAIASVVGCVSAVVPSLIPEATRMTLDVMVISLSFILIRFFGTKIGAWAVIPICGVFYILASKF